MTQLKDLIEIYTFATIEEIWSLDGFKHDNPIWKDNYEELLGDYNFDELVSCCFQKDNGRLCGEPHKWGFVARLKDGSVTMVGNHCATDKFGADARIRTDARKYLNEKKRQERLARLVELLEQKEERLTQVGTLRERLRQLRDRMNGITQELGPRTVRRLEEMVKTGRPDVMINAISYREYTDDDGQQKKERSSVPARLGVIAGLPVIGKESFQSIYSAIREVEQAYVRAEELPDNATATQIEKLVKEFNDIDRALIEGEKLFEAEERFLRNDFLLFCFLVDDKGERYKAARIAMDQAGDRGGRERVKEWLFQREKQLRENLKADRLEILY